MRRSKETLTTTLRLTAARSWCVFDQSLHGPSYPTSISNAKPEVGI